jgi:tetratricopeptide (TPR) repeat protein
VISDRSRHVLLSALLAGALLAVYGQVYTHGFVEFDDPGYVTDNPVVRRGLTLAGVRWAFTTGHMGSWHPLTWLSHLLDVQLFGLNAGAHHLVSVALHLANTLLLLAVWRRMTRALWPSFAVAALFALHPLRVESVAWISERKDVLSTLFWFLTLWAYARYVEARSPRWYAAMLAFFVLGLMAKPMLVTVPFVLLLLDFWPLGRIAFPGSGSRVSGPRFSPAPPVSRKPANSGPRTRDPGLGSAVFVEKLPLFAIAGLFSAVTYVTQLQSGAVTAVGSLPIDVRVANALVAYVRYLAMTVWPVDLAVLYPYDTNLPLWQPAGASLAIGVVSLVVLRGARRHPYALVGWLWYLGTLVPVIGLVQIGNQALADRYTYVPLIGVFLILAWGGQSLLTRWRIPPPAVRAVVSLAIGAYAAVAWAQVRLWKDGETLLSHTTRVTRANAVAHNNLGVALTAQDRIDAALEQYLEAVRINPDYADAHNNLGNALRAKGRVAEAIEHYEQALRLNASFPDAHYNLGISLAQTGRLEEAIGQYREALRLKPEYPEAHNNLGNALADAGRFDEAIEHYREALRIEPEFAEAHYNLGIALRQAGRLEEAIEHYRQALGLKPEYAEAHNNLGIALGHTSRFPEAIEHYREALRVRPDFADAHNNLGIALVAVGQPREAIGHFRRALEIEPDVAQAHNDLGVALVETGEIQEAIGHFEEALRLDPNLPDAQYNLGIALAMQSAAQHEEAGQEEPAE